MLVEELIQKLERIAISRPQIEVYVRMPNGEMAGRVANVKDAAFDGNLRDLSYEPVGPGAVLEL